MSTFTRLVVLIAPHRRWLAASILLGILATGSNIALITTSAYLISKAAIASGVAEIALVVTAVRVLAISRAGFLYLERLTTHRTAFRILSTLRVWFFRAVEPLAPARLVNERGGDLLARAVSDVDVLEDFYVKVLAPPFVAAVIVVLVVVILGLVDPVLGLTALAFLLISGVLLPSLSRLASRRSAAASAPGRGELSALIVDEVEGLADLMVLDQAAAHRQRLLGAATQLDAARDRLARIEAATGAMSLLMASLAALTVLGLAIPMVAGGRLEGVFLACLPLAVLATFEAVAPLSQAVLALDESRAAAQRVFALADMEPAVPVARASDAVPTSFDIEVRGLSFRYSGDGPPVLDGFDLAVGQGETVGLVGASGAGKSTLVGLLLRFWDIPDGAIEIGGRDIRHLEPDALRELIGVVPQQVHIFDTSIRENLAIADAETSDAAMMEACRTCQLGELISTLPEGLDTVVGENGVKLSGGERRMLGMARVLLKDPPIVVLDEATADLDRRTEQGLWAALAPFLASRTVLVISHRPADGVRYDRIVTVSID